MIMWGGCGRVLGFGVMVPLTVGTFLRSFTWGHVRRLGRAATECAEPGVGGGCRTRLRAADRVEFPRWLDILTVSVFGFRLWDCAWGRSPVGRDATGAKVFG